MFTSKKYIKPYQTRLFLVINLFISFVLIAGCATKIPKCQGDSPASEAQEKKDYSFKANSTSELIDTRKEFHDAALNYMAYSVEYPLYLLGIEKPRDNSETPYPLTHNNVVEDVPTFDITNLNASLDDQGDIRATLDDPRSLVLTHILSTPMKDSTFSNSTRKGCFIFNVYMDETSAPWCEHNHITQIEKEKNNWTREGWRGLDRLGDEIKEAAQRENATHIIVLATGWNTVEYESFMDFSYWMNILAEDFVGKEVFRPIFIGISWESAWPSSFWAKLPFGSWSTKGNDADAIGFTWVNYLLNDILKPIAYKSPTQIVAIGHSFGSRIILGSHYARDILVRKKSNSDTMPITLIGLQAAFPTGRFTLTEGKEHEYTADKKDSAIVVITTSTKDKATGTIGFGTGYIGGAGGLKELVQNKKPYANIITVPVLSTDNTGQPDTGPHKELVSVYDATPFVECELQGTTSGAHSDVFDQEMGHFLGETIRASRKLK